MTFDRNFIFGAATSAYQVEGAVQEDGRGPSIWDVFSHTPGKVVGGDTGDMACNHFHLYRQDVEHMRAMGLQSYRFSIAWPRIFPQGRGRLNQPGLDFYKRLIDALLEAGIQPMATLYHWDLPQSLQDLGGWENRDTAEYFGEYADTVFHHLGNSVPHFITLNEPWCSTVLGHVYGTHAPGIQDISAGIAASHHLLLAHGRAVQAFRAASLQNSQVGMTNILTHVESATDTKDDVAATDRMDAFLNRWFLDPIFHCRYPDELMGLGISRHVQPGDMDVIGQNLDFMGVNYYQRSVVRANPSDPLLGAAVVPQNGLKTAMGWEVWPHGLQSVLERIHREYGPIPLYVTESGAAFDDMRVGDAVHDSARLNYLRDHLAAVATAIQNGVDVRGYYVWSLMDNFEWAEGYAKRFGLLYVDYTTQERIWKDSAKYYRGVIATRDL